MGYADVRKRNKPQPIDKPQPRIVKDTARFKVETVYKSSDGKFVCVDRYTDEKGTRVGMVELREVKEQKRDKFGDVDYREHRECGFACHDEFFVRTHNGVEYAIDESDLCLLDGEKDKCGDRYDIDCDGCLEEVPDIAQFRADRPCGVEKLEMPSAGRDKPKGKRKSKKGNPIVGLIIIVVIATLIRACCP